MQEKRSLGGVQVGVKTGCPTQVALHSGCRWIKGVHLSRQCLELGQGKVACDAQGTGWR
jgi:hypothetical protein